MPLFLYEHNQKAYEQAIQMLKETGRAAVLHPTGTGKSLIGFHLAEQHPDARICWLSPSRYIIRQQKENLKKIAPDYDFQNITFLTYARLMANRDRAGGLKPDYIILDEFHRCGATEWGKGVQALFQSCPKAKVLGLSATSIRYLDEQRDMARELFDGHVASEMSLGEAIARGILQAPCYVISVYGYERELEKYSRKVEALKKGPRREQAERVWEKLRRALGEAGGLDGLFQKYLKRDGRYLVFCSGRSHLEEMKAHAEEWFGPVNPAYRIYSVYAENPDSREEFQAFQKKEKDGCLKLLFSIDMLNEGIHMEAVDGVILLRPTVSPIIYKQQIGRALTAGREGRQNGVRGNEKKAAPLILDIVGNFESLHSIDSIEMEFEQAVQIFGCPASGAEGMAGEETFLSGRRFQILDETKNARRLFEELQERLCASWDDYYREAAAYRQEYGDLEIPSKYITPGGLLLGSWLLTQRRIYLGKIPGHLEEERIRRLEELGISWESDSDRQWDRYYQKAADYYARHGNLDVKGSYVTEDGFRLGLWLNNIRQYGRNGSCLLSGARRRQMEQIGMIWDKLFYKWEQGYEAARQYYERYGNLDVPSGYETENGFRLGNWIGTQRQIQRGSHPGALPLREEQIARLSRIGMNWSGKQGESWEKHYEAARAYREQNGSLDVPYVYVTQEGVRLGRWLDQQRRLLGEKRGGEKRRNEGESGEETGEETSKKRGRRHEKDGMRIRLLTELGMDWESDPWKEKWERARRYYEEHGHLELAQNYVTEDGVWLGKWVYLQRERYRKQMKEIEGIKERGEEEETKGWDEEKDKKGTKQGEKRGTGKKDTPWQSLSREQIEALESIGMDWQAPGERAWEKAFGRAKAYYELNHHLEIPKGYEAEDGFRLDLWVKRQRKQYRERNEKVLTRERIARLESLGMRW